MKVELEITSLAHGGDGIGRIEGQVCFVPGALPGDVVRVTVRRQKKNALWAGIDDVVQPSPHRTAEVPAGAATWRHFAYPAQAEWKRRITGEVLQRIGGVTPDLGWHEEPSLRLGYRTRAEFHGDGNRFGFFAPGTHDVVDVPACPLSHERLKVALAGLRPLNLKGSVTVTVNPEGPETLIWTAFASRKLKHAFPQAQCTLDESPRDRFMFDGVPIVNGAFSQSSLLLNRLLVRVTHAAVGKCDSLLDLYCGNGNLSLGLAAAARVTAFDHHRPSVEAAKSLGTGDYRTGDEQLMIRAIRDKEWDVILLDPPRTGAKALTEALAACRARALVYVSCDPATFARDLHALAGGGWRPGRVEVLDLFPHTPHVETVCRLER